MIEIDGSYGEGGGQILRTAVSLSAVTMKPVRILNIRAGRPSPGLKKQHIAGIRVTGMLVNAEIEGLEVGSTEVVFKPRERVSGRFSYDVGTAGSISLVLQAVLPPAVLASEPVIIDLKGGTDVAWSPPIDFIKNVFVPFLKMMGANVHIDIKRRGHYPRGGGRVVCTVVPTSGIRPLKHIEFGAVTQIEGISHCVRLPSHIAKRQAIAARDVIQREIHVEPNIVLETYMRENDPHRGPGSGIVLWAVSDTGARVGADSLGERGKPAETVGQEAARKLVSEVSTGMAVDSHVSDMLVPYLALAEGDSVIGITKVTSHLETNVWVAGNILGTEMRLDIFPDERGKLSVRGRGLASFS